MWVGDEAPPAVDFVGGCDDFTTWCKAVQVQSARTAGITMNPAASAASREMDAGLLGLTEHYDRSWDWRDSSQELRRMIRSRVLLFTDMRDRPELFFQVGVPVKWWSGMWVVVE